MIQKLFEKNKETYKKPLIISLVLHGVLLFFLLFQLTFSNKPPVLNNSVNIVKAVAVDQSQVEATVAKLKEQQEAERNQAIAEKNRLQKQLEEYAQQRQQEQMKLEKIKESMQQQEAQRLAAQKAQQQAQQEQAKKLAEIKQMQLKEQQRLQKIQQEKQALEQQKQKEADAVEKLKLQQKVAAEKAAKEAKEKLAKNEKTEKEQPKKTAVNQRKQEIEQALQEAKQEEALLKKNMSAQKKKLSDRTQEAQEGKPDKEPKLSAQDIGEIDKYKGLILQAIGRRWLVPENIDRTLSCKLLIRVGAGGKVLNVQLVESSGDPLLDRSALKAVYKASPLPVPEDAALFDKFREFSLTVRPEGLLSAG